MTREYRLYTVCVKCGEKDITSYKFKKDYREACSKLANPYYCHKCDPKLLHGEDKLNFALSTIGWRVFSLYLFRSYKGHNARIETISHVECDQTVTYRSSGEETEIKWTRIYHTSKYGDNIWENVERMRTAHLVTQEDKDEIVKICKDGIANAGGWTVDEQIAGYNRIIEDVTYSSDFYVLP